MSEGTAENFRDGLCDKGTIPCRIIYFHRLHFPAESGQTIQILRDYHAMAGHGHEVHLYYRNGCEVRPEHIRAILREEYDLPDRPEVHMHYIPDSMFSSMMMTRAIIRTVQSAPLLPSILVSRTIDSALRALSIRRMPGLKRLRVLIELHETAMPHLVYAENGRRIKSWISKMREKRVFSAVDGMLFTVGAQMTLMDKLFPGHARGVVLPNGVSGKLLGAVFDNSGRDSLFHLRYAGQFSGWKNVGSIIDALRYLQDTVVLDIAGGKKREQEKNRRMLSDRARAAGVANRVRYEGALSPSEVPGFLAGADALMLPLGNNMQSRYFTSPMKLFEYAASGRPMVVTRQPTTMSLVEDGVHAVMVEPDAPESIAEGVRRIMSDAAFSERLAANAREWVASYTYEKRAERYNSFLAEEFCGS